MSDPTKLSQEERDILINYLKNSVNAFDEDILKNIPDAALKKGIKEASTFVALAYLDVDLSSLNRGFKTLILTLERKQIISTVEAVEIIFAMKEKRDEILSYYKKLVNKE